jgi:hypothetical protein
VTDAGSRSDRCRGRICRATLAVALSTRVTDARTPERQTCYVSVCRLGFLSQANARATDARARLMDGQGTRLLIIFVKWSLLDCVRHDDRRCDSAAMDTSISWSRPLRIRSSRTRGMIVCDRRGHGVCRPRTVPNGSFQRGTSIYVCWLALGLYSWTFEILVSTLS